MRKMTGCPSVCLLIPQIGSPFACIQTYIPECCCLPFCLISACPSVNLQCRGVLLIWITVGQRPIVLAVGACGRCLDIFSLVYHLSFLSPSLWETARCRLKYCLKGPLSLKQPTNQQTTHPSVRRPFVCPSIHPSP